MDTDELLAKGSARRLVLPELPRRRAIRVAAGVTQQELAVSLGVRRASICRYELGTREPRGELRVRYSEALEALRRV